MVLPNVWLSTMPGMLALVPKPDLSSNALRRYLVAVLLPTICIVARWYFWHQSDDGFPYATMFLPIAFSAYYGGFGPGLTSVLVTMTVGNFFFVPPAFSLQIPKISTAVSLLAFAVTGLLICVLGEVNRKALAQGSAEEEIRRAAQETLKANEERLRIVENLMSAGLWDWKIPTNQVYWSDGYRRMVDVPLDEEPSYDKALETVHPEDRQRTRGQIDELFHKHLHNWSFEYRIRTATGRVRWVTGNGQIFYDAEGKPARMVGLNVDVTARKAAEQALRNNEARMKLLLQYARVGGWEWDPKERSSVWSDQMYAALGLDRSLPATFETWLAHVHPEDREYVRDLLHRLLAGSEDQFQYEYRVIGSDGVERCIHDRGMVVRDVDGRSPRMVGVSFDITNRQAEVYQHLQS